MMKMVLIFVMGIWLSSMDTALSERHLQQFLPSQPPLPQPCICPAIFPFRCPPPPPPPRAILPGPRAPLFPSCCCKIFRPFPPQLPLEPLLH
ncbi:hypothetical protein VIGAN_01147500 [Vigna angularis var. angularis]|uniref:Hydrophobic seed protein domain-containing protein n=1 Tax=Vigna angularis var. angularis TaxID=157739 RepID=A0A0S3QZX0_PHAAN|nr:hypothetical protein VIGAN_01147500 [Vigna angularis var. angularis]